MHLSCNDSVPPARPIHQFSCISSNSNQPNSLSRLPSAILFCFFTIPSHVCDATMPLFFSNLAVTVSFSSSFSLSFFLLLPPPLSRSGTFRLWCDGSVIHSSSLFTFFSFFFTMYGYYYHRSRQCYMTRTTPPSYCTQTHHTAHVKKPRQMKMKWDVENRVSIN